MNSKRDVVVINMNKFHCILSVSDHVKASIVIKAKLVHCSMVLE